MCINSQNIIYFFSDVVYTCVVYYIEQATAGRGGGGAQLYIIGCT